ncbi:MAG: LamG domain-containing protein [Planctomycetota bacterium]
MLRLASRLAPWMIVAFLLTGPAIADEDYCLYFGHGGQVIVEETVALDADAAFTVECRFRSAGTYRSPISIVSRWSDDTKAEDPGLFYLALSGSKRVIFGVRNEDGGEEIVAGFGDWSDGRWHHLAATRSGTTLVLYFDGEEVERKDLPKGQRLSTTRRPLVFGPAIGSNPRRPVLFEGCLGDVAIWDAAKTADEIGAIARGMSKGAADRVAHYPLRASRPTAEARDGSAGARHGRLDESLARSGWMLTVPWDDPDPDRHTPDLHCYDLADVLLKGEGNPGRKILVDHEKEQRVGAIWQDAESRQLGITWVDASRRSHETHSLAGPQGALLAAGTTDPEGNVYYLVIEERPEPWQDGTEVAATLYKASATGEPIGESSLDVTQSALDLFAFSRGVLEVGNMRYSRGFLGVILPLRMHRSADGLRHQRAIALVFNAKNLQLLRDFGQTSGHSKANLLKVGSKGSFLAIDLGDNYPRGVHLHEFDKNRITSRLVFTFKTAHATESRNGSPVYEEISGDGRTFYKWSNDNGVYTELGGIVEGRGTYLIVFATDRSPEGRVLDNSRAFRDCPDPRNLAMVRVVQSFGRAPSGGEVSNAIMAGLPRNAEAETGGFFVFGGGWTKQRVVGVQWLTNYWEGEAAHAPHMIERAGGSVLLLWEKTGSASSGLHSMTLDEKGEVVQEEHALGYDLHLNRQDRLLSSAEAIHLLAGHEPGGPMRLYFLRDVD